MELFNEIKKIKFKLFKKALPQDHFTFFEKEKTNFQQFKNSVFPEKTYNQLISNKFGLLFIQFIVISCLALLSKNVQIVNLNDYLTFLMLTCTMPVLIRIFRYVLANPLAWAVAHLQKEDEKEKLPNVKFFYYPLLADIFFSTISVAYMLYLF